VDATVDELWPWQTHRVGLVALSRISVGIDFGTESCKDTRPQPTIAIAHTAISPLLAFNNGAGYLSWSRCR